MHTQQLHTLRITLANEQEDIRNIFKDCYKTFYSQPKIADTDHITQNLQL